MDKLESLLAVQNVEISILRVVINLLLAAGLSLVLSYVYVKYGRSLSNRRAFARNFVVITVTTMLVITIVKSSLALSLGLVGALSIVRFRAAIKEPEELSFLFLSIAIGLGFGADQRLITLVVFALIVAFIWVRSRSKKAEERQNLLLTVSSHNPRKAELSEIVGVLGKHCSKANLKRFDETKEALEASFLVEFDGFPQLEASRLDLKALGDSVRITFLDNKGIEA